MDKMMLGDSERDMVIMQHIFKIRNSDSTLGKILRVFSTLVMSDILLLLKLLHTQLLSGRR